MGDPSGGFPTAGSGRLKAVSTKRLDSVGAKVAAAAPSDTPAISQAKVESVARQAHGGAPLGEVKLVRLSLVEPSRATTDRLVWAVTIDAPPDFAGGPAPGTGASPTPSPNGTFWVEFYDATTSDFVFGFSGEN